MDGADEPPGPRDREMEEVRWFPLEEASDVAGFDSEKEVIQKATQAVTG
jgi:hypothetical protein